MTTATATRINRYCLLAAVGTSWQDIEWEPVGDFTGTYDQAWDFFTALGFDVDACVLQFFCTDTNKWVEA